MTNNVTEDQPAGFANWPEQARDRFNERVALLREQNNIQDTQRTPLPYLRIAQKEAFELVGWTYKWGDN